MLNKQDKIQLLKEIQQLSQSGKWVKKSWQKTLRRYPKKDGFYSKSELLKDYKELVDSGDIDRSEDLEKVLRMKPTRTDSGVATVSVLTKPYPCPGECIFCPNDVRMPKSYLADEPGAQRAERNLFHPYLQTYNRLHALQNTGHDLSKVELIVLGGTWSYYPLRYQIWFIKECFRALNEFGIKDDREEIEKVYTRENSKEESTDSTKTYNELILEIQKDRGESIIPEEEGATWEELEKQHVVNETAQQRCVGLVIETRPDHIDEKEVVTIRRLGATKVQMGIQSMSDTVLTANKRGHDAQSTKDAITLLRKAAFKIHGHWMPNLHMATPESDIADYKKLWEQDISPDELKIYPTSIIANTELFELYKRGEYKPYTYEELLNVLTSVMPATPRYCRLTRVIRDIPAQDIVAGNTFSNFRQIAEKELNEKGDPCECIRCREIKGESVTEEDIELEIIKYKSSIGGEVFISYKTKETDKILGFLRLTLPNERKEHYIQELTGAALIREIHVYGKVVGIGDERTDQAQHLGIGSRLIDLAIANSMESGFDKISVISAVGTRRYYEKNGFTTNGLYMERAIS